MKAKLASAIAILLIISAPFPPAAGLEGEGERAQIEGLAATEEHALPFPKLPPGSSGGNATGGPRPVFLELLLNNGTHHARDQTINITIELRAFDDVENVTVYFAPSAGLRVQGPLVLGPFSIKDGESVRELVGVNAVLDGVWTLVVSTATPDGRVDSIRQEGLRLVVGPQVEVVQLDTPEEESLPHASGTSSLHPAPTSTASATSGFKARRVMYARGFDGGANDAGADVVADWASTRDMLIRGGWTDDPDHHIAWGFYACDEPASDHVSNYGSHLAHRFSPEVGDHGLNYCGGLNWKGDSHDRDTSIRHLAYHFAHAVTSKFPNECVVGVGYSMGGLVLRYAAANIGRTDFPANWCMEDIATFATPHEGYDESQDLNTLCDGIHYQCDEMRPGSTFITWLRDNAYTPPGDWTTMGSIGDTFVTAQSGTGANDMRNIEKVVFNENIEHTEWPNNVDDYHWKETARDDITADVSRTDADGFTAPTVDAPWPLRYIGLSLAYLNWGCGTYAAPWSTPMDALLHGEPFYSNWDCYYALDVPVGADELVVELRGITMADRDLEIYRTLGGAVECGAYTGSADETCRVAFPAAGIWYVRMLNHAQTLDPFTIRAYTQVTHEITGVRITSSPASVAANADYQICWAVDGIGSISHTNLHWGTSPGVEEYYSPGRSGTAPSGFCETLTAPASGTVFLTAHASGPNDNIESGEIAIPVTGGGGGRVEIARHDGVIDSTGEFSQTGTFITFNTQGSAPVEVAFKYCYLAGSNGRSAEVRTVFDGVVVDAKSFTTPYTGGASCVAGSPVTYATHTVSLSSGVASTIRFDYTNGDWRVSIAEIVVTAEAGGSNEIARHDPHVESAGGAGWSGTLLTFDNVQGTNPIEATYKYCYLGDTNGADAQIMTVFDGTVVDTLVFRTPYSGGGTCTHGDVSTYQSRTFTVSAGVSTTIRFDFVNGDWRVAMGGVVVRDV